MKINYQNAIITITILLGLALAATIGFYLGDKKPGELKNTPETAEKTQIADNETEIPAIEQKTKIDRNFNSGR
jgi:hypothetical protein